MVIKMAKKIKEQEFMWIVLRKYLETNNIRMVYRALSVIMPPRLKKALIESGASIWGHFTETSVNNFEIKGVMSQELGYTEAGLHVPVEEEGKELEDFRKTVATPGSNGKFFDKQYIDIGSLKQMISEADLTTTELKRMIEGLTNEVQ
jgi:hypothetical protein